MQSSRKFLRRVIERKIRTFHVAEELLECGHRQDAPLTDSLTAKHRVCPQCAKVSALPSPKKPPTSTPTFLRDPGRYEPPWKKTG
jgi:hypothetical protein